MKIGVMSDSHEHVGNIQKSIEYFNSEKVDLVVHCGDIISPIMCRFFEKSKCKIIFVFGNNDGEKIFLKQQIENIGHEIYPGPYEFEFGNKKILLMHEPYGLNGLKRSDYYDIIFYGHTHEYKLVEGKPMIINPGETCNYLTGNCSIGILDLNTMEYIKKQLY